MCSSPKAKHVSPMKKSRSGNSSILSSLSDNQMQRFTAAANRADDRRMKAEAANVAADQQTTAMDKNKIANKFQTASKTNKAKKAKSNKDSWVFSFFGISFSAH